MKKRSVILLLSFVVMFLWILTSCGEVSPAIPSAPVPTNQFDNPKIVQIYDLADRREGDSLLPFLSDTDPFIRSKAAMVFGSVQDPHALPQLQALLLDRSADVVTAAAWAIGQIGDSTAAPALLKALESNQGETQGTIGEALGKAGTTADIAAAIGFARKQPSANPAAMQAVYRAGLRKRVPAEAQAFALDMLTETDATAQLYGAAFLGRVADSGPIQDPQRLLDPLRKMANADARQLLVRACARCADSSCTRYLQGLVTNMQEDPLVRANGFRSSGGVHPLVEQGLTAVQGAEEQVAVAAAEYLETAYKGSTPELLQVARKTNAWRPRAILLKTAMRQSKGAETATVTHYIDTLMVRASLYEQAALYSALGQSPAEHERLITLAKSQQPVLSTYAFEAYLAYYPKSIANNRPVIQSIMQVMQTGEPGLVAMGAEHIAAAEIGFLAQITRTEFLDSALNKLHLPEDIEAYNAVLKAIAKVRAQPYEAHTLGFQHPIDWDLVRGIPSGQRAEIVTNRGKIVLQLHVEDAPGTVANFVKLVQDGFYNGKKIHRVVPSFVAQGGCPRGDGWGSTPETIRSEWAQLHYEPGAVGMASAGKDTESCQWFITHCSVPHLDGRYTIFASVVTGMEVVQLLEIGDEIQSISLPGLSS